MEIVVCPRCGQPAEVEWRDPVPAESLDHAALVKLRCLDRHWFLMPTGHVQRLESPTSTTPAPDSPQPAEPA